MAVGENRHPDPDFNLRVAHPNRLDVDTTLPVVQPSPDVKLNGQSEVDAPEQAVEAVLQEPVITTPARSGILTTFKTAIAAAVGRHETKIVARNVFGKEVERTLHSKDVLEIENKAFAERQLSETKDKWDPKSIEGLSGWQRFGKGVERLFDRMWRGTLTEGFHRAKEYKHGLKLTAAAGIEGAVTTEFNTEIDRRAREQIKTEHSSRKWYQKIGYNAKNAFQEVFAMERDLHKKKVEITGNLRSQYENSPLDNTNPLFHLINRDIAAREEMARHLHETPIELLKQSHEKNQKVSSVKLEGEQGKKVEKFLKEQILTKVMDEAIATRSTKISQKLHSDLDRDLQNYFFSEEFQAWRQTLTPDQQKAFENSFTYASDVLVQAEEGLIPAVLDNLDHYQSADRLNFDIELTLGTAQFGANTEAKKNEWGSNKERASLNKKIWDRMRREVGSGTDASFPHRAEAINQGLKRERIISAIDSIGRSEVLAAGLGLFGTKLATSALRASTGWIPVGGGVAAGAVAGWKEWGRMDRMRAQYGYEETMGMSHPQAANAVRSTEFRGVDYNRLEMGRRIQQLGDISQKLGTPNFNETDVIQALGYLADSNARINLGNKHGINLLTASKNTAEGYAIFQREQRLHDLARVATIAKVQEALGNPDLLTKVGEKMGIAEANRNFDNYLTTLTNHLESNLEQGTQVPAEVQVALGALTIDQALSIQARDRSYSKLRLKSVGKRAATTGVIAGLASAGLGEFFTHHETVTSSGVETTDVQTIDHTLPLHLDDLPTGIGQINDPSTGDLITMHAHIPDGTSLVADPIRVGSPDDFEPAFNLVADDTNETLVRGMQFTGDGELQMTTEVREALAHNHIDYAAHPLATIGLESSGTETIAHADVDLRAWDLEGYKEEGFWGWYSHTLGQDGHQPTNQELNSVLKTFRGYEIWEKNSGNVTIADDPAIPYPQVVHTKDLADELFGQRVDVVAAPQGSKAVFEDVSWIWGTPEGHQTIAKTFLEAKDQFEAGIPFSDEAHRIVYEAGTGGEHGIPDANEIKTLIDYYDGAGGGVSTVTPHDVWFTATESITKPVEVASEKLYTMTVPDWWTALVPAGFHRPLEVPVGKLPTPPTEQYAPIYQPLYQPISGGYSYLSGAGNQRVMKRRLEDGTFAYYRPLADEEKWARQRSQTLKDNPQAQLDQLNEINNYFNRMDPARVQRLDTLNNKLREPMSESVRGVVCIPVAAASEMDNIEHTLDLLAQQTGVNHKDFEVIVYLNWLKGADQSKISETRRAVERFAAKDPTFPIRIVEEERDIAKEDLRIGEIMKTVNDLALKRIQNANISEDVMITVLPADVKGLSKTFLEGLVENARSPKDVLTSSIDFGTMYYDKFPGFHIPMRVLQGIIRVSESNYPAPVFTSGSGLQKKAAILAAVGGYDETAKMGEDADIGMKVVAARLGNKEEYLAEEFPIGRSPKTWNEVDPARLLQCYKDGKSILSAWSDFTQEGYKARPIGNVQNQENLDLEWNDVVNRIEFQLSSLDANYPDDLVTRAMNFIVPQQNWKRLEKGKILLTDEGKSKLKAELIKYRDENLKNKRYQNRGVRIPEAALT